MSSRRGIVGALCVFGARSHWAQLAERHLRWGMKSPARFNSDKLNQNELEGLLFRLIDHPRLVIFLHLVQLHLLFLATCRDCGILAVPIPQPGESVGQG